MRVYKISWWILCSHKALKCYVVKTKEMTTKPQRVHISSSRKPCRTSLSAASSHGEEVMQPLDGQRKWRNSEKPPTMTTERERERVSWNSQSWSLCLSPPGCSLTWTELEGRGEKMTPNRVCAKAPGLAKQACFSSFYNSMHSLWPEKWVCVWRRTRVCRLPKSLRSLVTHDTKLWKGMCTAPDANRSDSSSTSLPSHCIPAKEKDRWRSEVKWAAGNLGGSRTHAYQQLVELRWAQRGSSCQTSPRRTGQTQTGERRYVRIRK